MSFYTFCMDSDKSTALLFHSTNLDEVGAIPELQELFPSGYALRLVNYKNPTRYNQKSGAWETTEVAIEEAKCIIVSAAPLDFPPDKASAERAPLGFFYKGQSYVVGLRARYNQCLSLFKAVGCDRCPSRGIECLGEHFGVKVEDLPLETDLTKDFKNGRDVDIGDQLELQFRKLGNFEFISPHKTRTDNQFASNLRKYWEHSFELIDQNADELSRRAEKGAASKAFKKDQCSKCVINDSCDSFRYCKGAYPPPWDIIDGACHDFFSALDRSELKLWQLWEAGVAMGNEAKHSRYEIWMAGLAMQGQQIVPIVKRRHDRVQEYKLPGGWEALCDKFGMALREEDSSVPPVIDPEHIAILWMVLRSPHAYKRYGWGSEQHVGGIGLWHDGVIVRWVRASYVSGSETLRKVSDVAKKITYGRLGDTQKIEVRP